MMSLLVDAEITAPWWQGLKSHHGAKVKLGIIK